MLLPDNIKQYADTTAAHIKLIIELLKDSKCVGAGVSTIWNSTYSCTEYYRCATELYLLSILPKSFNIIIDRGIIAPEHVRKVVDGLNATYKRFIFHLMATIQLPSSKKFNIQTAVHTETQNIDASLALE